MGRHYSALRSLAADPGLARIGNLLAGVDGRTIRKLVAEAMATDLGTALDPGRLGLQALEVTAHAVVAARRSARSLDRGEHDAAA